MKKWYLIIIWVFFLVSILFSGCAHVVNVEKPKLNIENTIAKLRPADKSKGFDDERKIKTVGVLIELKSYAKIWRGALYGGWRKEEEVYKIVSSNIMSSLEKAGIGASLIYNETDPRLENIGIIFHIEYSERIETAQVWDDKLTTVRIPGPLQMSMPVGGYKDVSKIVESYYTTIFDIKTGEKRYYNKLEEAVSALGEKSISCADKCTSMYNRGELKLGTTIEDCIKSTCK
ncbi:MAG: hypothetical protein Q7J31_02915 [Syntrophales bacterium]|nr:hypothetical protein [Syntrophales bacterium]